MSASKAERARVAARRARAADMRIAGASWQQIADALRYRSRGAACQDVGRAFEAAAKAEAQSTETLRALELERIDALWRKAWAVMEADHVRISGGRVVSHDGQPLRDDRPVLRAVETLLRLAAARWRLLGLDAPVKVDAGVTVRYEIVGPDGPLPLDALR